MLALLPPSIQSCGIGLGVLLAGSSRVLCPCYHGSGDKRHGTVLKDDKMTLIFSKSILNIACLLISIFPHLTRPVPISHIIPSLTHAQDTNLLQDKSLYKGPPVSNLCTVLQLFYNFISFTHIFGLAVGGGEGGTFHTNILQIFKFTYMLNIHHTIILHCIRE